ncbi:MAG TPA: lipid-A-disaccharide synthase [Ignavibacteriaceae bacterium]|nr:lipid-A-disaccharide synthase [Ignavibacteriaceae bacterium]
MIENEDKKQIMIIAGEISGDLIGASLIRELKKLNGELVVCGIGGDRMKAEGMELLFHISQMAFLGLTEIISHLPFIRKVKHKLIDEIKRKKIKNVVLIDYPGFNLNIAGKIKSMGAQIIYYVSPQLWAWGKGRVIKIKKLVDKMLVVFPFEEQLYKDKHVDVEFVGHPLVERINEYNFLEREVFFKKFNLDLQKEILLLMPGSRKQEVIKIFPETIKAANKLANDFNMQIVVAGSTNINDEIFYTAGSDKDFKIIKGFNYELMKYSKFGIIKSGTSTLEAGYFDLPMVIVYKTNILTYLVGKKLIKVKNLGMVNILLGENVVPELIQGEVSESSIYQKCSKFLIDEAAFTAIKEKLKNVREILGADDASRKAAVAINNLINEY